MPATPDWSVRGIYAHVVGINDDIVAGRLEGIGSDAWTAAQVTKRNGLGIAEICDEWEALAPAIDAITGADPFLGLRMLADLVVHEHDVATALCVEAERDGDGVDLALERYAPTLIERADAAGVGGVAVVTGSRIWGDPRTAAVTVGGTAFDLLRSIAGRRTIEQVRSQLSWSVDPTPWLPLISTYGLPTSAIDR